MQLQNQLFTEQLRPKTLEQAILLPRIKAELSKGLVDHLIFTGPQGTGKSTLTKIMSASYDTLEINASLERGIDVIRDKVISFASSSSLLNGSEQLKVVVLEECDNMTNDAWASLRSTIERYHKTVRFIANCNYIDKIPAPIQSRFNVIPVYPINSEEETWLIEAYKQRIQLILNSLKISVTPENLDIFVKNDFPDMRSLIKKIQQLVTKGQTELSGESLNTTFDCSALFNVILSTPNPWQNYKDICGEWGNKADEGVLAIGKNFPEYLRNSAPSKINKLPAIIVEIASHNDMLSRSTDKLVTLLSLVYKLQMILNS